LIPSRKGREKSASSPLRERARSKIPPQAGVRVKEIYFGSDARIEARVSVSSFETSISTDKRVSRF
jgi:hypothetical protein